MAVVPAARSAAHRLRDELRRRGSAGLRRSPAQARLAQLTVLENEWRGAGVRDDRINGHLRRLLATCGVTNGRVLEIGGRRHPRGHVFGAGFDYLNLDLEHSDERTVVGDITACPEIADASFDVVVSVDVFEHLDRPWLAAEEITRILAPGGLSYTSTLFSWRYHPCPIDYYRYTPDALAFLFGGLDVIEQGFDTTERRRDVRKKAARDPMPLDALGGWRENVRVFHAGRKPRTAA
ncbi:methyltransferase domain-containing protein [uncultured Jatrophihabitans sp.]|uniref:methyltransferase domain-containing protein n=1 Tax=uncultured Jatrophihabitans sp. TaxID=1610747 RepID=UPI0035CADB2C